MQSNSKALVVSSRAIVGIAVIIALVVALVLVMNLEVFGASTGVTVTSTQTVGASTTVTTTFTSNPAVSGNASSPLGINAEQIYSEANLSIVILQGMQAQSSLFGTQYVSILGSGFVVQYSGSDYIVTNYHVAGATTNLTVTFSDGDSYPATVVGSDPYADLAIVSAKQAPASEFHALTFTPSSNLLVGEPIVAIGAPFGLSGSMTVGIISQLGRTIQDPTAGNFSIAAVIQFSAPINPGNSGGPLLDSNGDVVGITTAVVQS
ncbi:MAG TPA: trypsin-like peptidase domain-containing protein, partial [Nitrososphaerales archaeon]|nr:trypsin-like peptidase domain-containing protein [Nitrososphaerales archaeon]